MIDRQIIEALPDDMRAAVKASIVTIVQSGVVATQLNNMRESVLAGSDTQDAAELAQRILEFRKRQVGLKEFLLLAQKLTEE